MRREYQILQKNSDKFIPQWRHHNTWGIILGWNNWYKVIPAWGEYSLTKSEIITFKTKSEALTFIAYERELRRAAYDAKLEKKFKEKVVWNSN